MTGPLFLYIISGGLFFFMDKEKLKLIINNLESLVGCLKSEVYSDVDMYTTVQENFDDPAENYILDYDEVFEDDDG